METKWISEIAEVPTASDESLKMSLLTIDGRGRALKTAALEELLKRAREFGKNEARAFSSAGERCLHTAEVIGSNPVVPTKEKQ